MSVPLITIEVTRQGIGVKAGLWNELLREAWLHAIRLWFRFILPKHFTREAITEYNYEARSPSHEKRKARLYGHRRPLVFSGRLMREVLARKTDIIVTAKGGRARLHGPSYLWAYRKDYSQPDKAKELSALSDRDTAFLAKVMDKFITKRARQMDSTPAGPAAARVGMRLRSLSA